jgi:hypothetical protein
MDYKTKIQHAERVAEELQNMKNLDQIKSDLKSKDIYESDINKIVASARNIIGEKYHPKIKEYLMADKPIHGAEEFKLLDEDTLNQLITKGSKGIAINEKQKITDLIKSGLSPEEVFKQTDTRFLSADKAAEHISQIHSLKKQSSGSGRMISIGGGIGLILLTGILFVTIDRLFYVLPFIGIAMIVKGFLPEPVE